MYQIYWWTPMTKCDFDKVAFELYWNHISAWVLSCKFAAYFQDIFLQKHLWRVAFVNMVLFKVRLRMFTKLPMSALFYVYNMFRKIENASQNIPSFDLSGLHTDMKLHVASFTFNRHVPTLLLTHTN